jgi:hypothetical protein
MAFCLATSGCSLVTDLRGYSSGDATAGQDDNRPASDGAKAAVGLAPGASSSGSGAPVPSTANGETEGQVANPPPAGTCPPGAFCDSNDDGQPLEERWSKQSVTAGAGGIWSDDKIFHTPSRSLATAIPAGDWNAAMLGKVWPVGAKSGLLRSFVRVEKRSADEWVEVMQLKRHTTNDSAWCDLVVSIGPGAVDVTERNQAGDYRVASTKYDWPKGQWVELGLAFDLTSKTFSVSLDRVAGVSSRPLELEWNGPETVAEIGAMGMGGAEGHSIRFDDVVFDMAF